MAANHPSLLMRAMQIENAISPHEADDPDLEKRLPDLQVGNGLTRKKNQYYQHSFWDDFIANQLSYQFVVKDTSYSPFCLQGTFRQLGLDHGKN